MRYIGEKPTSNNHAGNKARVDVENILAQRYGEPIARYEEAKLVNVFERIAYYGSMRFIPKLYSLYAAKGFDILIQHPQYTRKIYRRGIARIFKNNTVYGIVHDIEELRISGKSALAERIDTYNEYEAIIVHNRYMEDLLVKNGLKIPTIKLELFDYLLPNGLPEQNYKLGKEVVFAGNLQKSNFLNDSDLEYLNFKWILYGPGLPGKISSYDNVVYKGSLPPDEVPYELKGSFGLIWDGDSINTCDGTKGEYMRYNNPHKLSLYIAAGLPVIVWKEAAIANFVQEHGIGFSISSLHEISSIIDSLTNEDYQKMLNNIAVEQKKVAVGYYTNRALDELEKLIID